MLSADQLAPSGGAAAHTVTGVPPVTLTFLICPTTKNPTHWPSAEKKGLYGNPSLKTRGRSGLRARLDPLHAGQEPRVGLSE